jgi:hypothetical protein
MRTCIVFLSLSFFAGIAHATNCSGLPTQFTGNEFPTGDFFSNFNNPCYLVAFGVGSGGGHYADLNSVYNQVFFKVDPRYQIIVVGTFPQGRYFSITVYDDHQAVSQNLLDTNIVPLTSQDVNPYLPGVAYVSGQQYAAPINFGGTPGTLETGCMMTGYNVDVNGMDATQRHIGMDWNSDAGVFAKYPKFALHVVDTPQHTNPNTAGIILIRNYLDISGTGSSVDPHVIVRDVASGCAYPAAYVLQTLQMVTFNVTTGTSWLAKTQSQAHNFYEGTYLPKTCFGTDPQNSLVWLRQTEYVPGANPNGSYLDATVPANLPATLAAAGEVMRFQFRLPTTPPTPCSNGCSSSGSEQMRYESLSFQSPGGVTLASIADSAFTTDSNGYVTLIVGTGAAIPSWITAANGYTFLDLTPIPSYQQLNLLALRNILPAASFNCAGNYVPFRMVEYTPVFGGLMGEYLPVVDYPIAANLPQVATPLQQASSCDMFPTGQPGVVPHCGVFTPRLPAISLVVTQCPAPGCNQFVLQPQPPMTITGGNLGNFPNGMPYTGTSNYLQIIDTTQNWSAGYTGDPCSVFISSWASNRIQLVANVNQGGMCPLAAGDQVTVKVWNPQTLTGPATATVTVAAN